MRTTIGRWRPTVEGIKNVQAQANPALPRSKTEQLELSIPGWLSHLLGPTLIGFGRRRPASHGVDLTEGATLTPSLRFADDGHKLVHKRKCVCFLLPESAFLPESPGGPKKKKM